VNRVSVVGSLHLDILVEASRLPMSDETLAGRSWSQKCGGKGGNQAVAAARFGAATAMGGRVGDDDFGRRMRDHLRAAKVDASCVETDPSSGSGMSVAIQESNGEYGAVIVSGANLTIDPDAIARDWASLWRADVLMLQNEVPEAVNLAAAKAVRAAGGRVMMNAAPARALSAPLLPLIHILVLNRLEAAQMSGLSVHGSQDVARAAKALHRGGQDLLITMGGDGLHLTTADGESDLLPAYRAKLRSAHGAGDCFCGALAARLARGEDIKQACAFAQAAAALFVAATPQEQMALSADRVQAFLERAG
jgi:ribokinase